MVFQCGKETGLCKAHKVQKYTLTEEQDSQDEQECVRDVYIFDIGGVFAVNVVNLAREVDDNIANVASGEHQSGFRTDSRLSESTKCEDG